MLVIAIRLILLRHMGLSLTRVDARRRKGPYHRKALIVNRRYAYTGGVNFAQTSKSKKEMRFRTSDSAANDVVKLLARDQGEGRVWDGR